jgi:hypothetical protein
MIARTASHRSPIGARTKRSKGFRCRRGRGGGIGGPLMTTAILSSTSLDGPPRPMLRSRPFRDDMPWRRRVGTSGRLKAKVDRLKKKLAEKGSTLAADKKRILTKKLKRFQRARRTALVLEKRAMDNKTKTGKEAPQTTQEKPSGAAPETPVPAG